MSIQRQKQDQQERNDSEPLTAEHIEGFVNLFILKGLDAATEIPECHKEWWRMCCSPHRYVAIAAPRNHAKSTAITHSYTLANVVLRKRSFVLLVSDTEVQATYFLADIKKELTENEDLIKVFGIKGLVKDNETDCIVEFDDGYQARLIAKGAEQKLRGVKWDHKRPDLIVCDDMENDEMVMNKERREKFRNWFSGALMPCKSTSGIVRYVGTILHMDAQLERLMPRETDKRNTYTDLSVIASYQHAIWYSAKYKAHTGDFKQVLWPSRWPAEKLKQEREHYVEQAQTDKWAQEYLNMPIDEATAFFKRGDLLPMYDGDYASIKNYYIGCDLAVTIGTIKQDYTVFVVAGIDEDGIIHIIDVIRERIESPDIVERVLELNKQYNPYYFFFEKGAITNSVLPNIKIRSIEDNNFVPIELFARIVDKVQFASAIKARIRQKRVKFDRKADWFPDLEQEMLRFPRDKHDDQVDSLAILGQGLQKFVEAATKLEVEQEEYDMEYMSSEVEGDGRSMWTGY